MRSLVEAGIALLIVYLFIKYKQGEAPAQALTDIFAPIQGTSAFNENPADASATNEGGDINYYGTPPPRPGSVTVNPCGCGCSPISQSLVHVG